MTTKTNEVLVDLFDRGWNRNLKVTLITYNDGYQDLHRQTGFDFDDAIAKAKIILAARGLTCGDVEFIGPTGAYMAVKPM